jgi:predicted Zn-dependent protease
MKLKFFLFLFLVLINLSAVADFKKGTVIRDAEIEKILKNYLDPLFKIAGLNPEEARIIMMVDPSLNAAALPNSTLLFYTGFLMETETCDEIAGVLAHEVGHIAARHLVRTYGAMENAQHMGLLGALVGVAVGLLGSPDAGLALVLGSSSQALHTFLHYRRSEEEAADMLAVKYLTALKWPIRGLRTFLEKLLGQELLSESLQDPYLRTHPITRDRVERIRAREGGTPKIMPNYFKEQHQRMVAKLKAFLWRPDKTLNSFKGASSLDIYAKSIAYYRQADFDKALALIEVLINKEPKNPFFWEFKGQILFDAGRIRESIAPYRKAMELFPDSALLQAALAQSLLQSEDASLIKEAILYLQKALQKEKDNGLAWQYLAIAYGREKKMAPMALALAEYGLVKHEWDYAREQAVRAQHFSKKAEKDYRRAEEIKKIAEENLKKES